MVPLRFVEFFNALQFFARRTWIQTGRAARASFGNTARTYQFPFERSIIVNLLLTKYRDPY